MKTPNPLEKEIERKVCQFARDNGCLHYKFTSMSRRSVPDRIFITPSGHIFWIEFKRRGEKPTQAQEVEISKLRNQGCTVLVIDDVEKGKGEIEAQIWLNTDLEDY
jgi:hypothetical protein